MTLFPASSGGLGGEIKTIKFSANGTISGATGANNFSKLTVTCTQDGTSYDLTKCTLLGVDWVASGDLEVILRFFNGGEQKVGLVNTSTVQRNYSVTMQCRYIVPSNA